MKIGLMCGREYSFPPAFIEKVNELGKKDGVTAEFVKLGGTKMGELAQYSVIIDRISHEVDYYRAYLKHAVLQGTYVINNPFWWTADDKFFNYAVASKLGLDIPKTVLLPQKSYPADVDINSESLRNLDYPIDWDGLLDYVGRPAFAQVIAQAPVQPPVQAPAQDSPDERRCTGQWRASNDDRITACTALIDSGRYQAANLAILHHDRGIAVRAKGDIAGAIGDFTEAIKLNPDYARAYADRGSARLMQRDLDGAIADLDRRHQCAVGADEGPFADGRAVLGGAIVVTGDRPRPDVDAAANLRVAQISQVIRLRSFAQARLLRLDKIADVRTLPDVTSRSQVRERPDPRSSVDQRIGNHARLQDQHRIANRCVLEY